MNSLSLLNDISFWDKVGTIFDVIPKVIYLLFACIASAADAMQLLVRRMCGLDLYYANGQTVEMQDPLTEFITGILGIGDSAGTMQALNTTFVSLSIFALILLALTSIIALIKSHYNEDTGKTSPIKIIYNAFKSIVTFAIVPIVVILGLQLSGVLLRTLDNITAASSTDESLVGIYGSNALTTFKPSGERDGVKYYSSYELFGFGELSTGTTISGQLFRAAAYECNRVRNGNYSVDYVKGNSTLNFGIFGQGPSYDSAESKQEYLAYQIDYAFINNLQLNSSVRYEDLKDAANDAGVWVQMLDFARLTNINYFSKYNTSLIWIYYNLWNFNFIVGFAGALSVFGIMVSIIIGLMMRLIKSAAMFLIYPPLLGLSPMDDFGAFKNWSKEFIKQILSAFGAIIGINLLFLILPFVQSISFFEFDLLNSIVNLVFLVTGLIMVKDFISMVAGFVGGGDVFSTGESNKANVAGAIKKGAMATVAAGAAATAAGVIAPATLAIRGASMLGARGSLKKMGKQYEAGERSISSAKTAVETAQNDYDTALSQSEKDWQNSHRTEMDTARASKPVLDKLYNDKYNEAYTAALGEGKSRADAHREAKESAYDALDKELEKRDSSWKSRKQSHIDWDPRVGSAKTTLDREKENLANAEDENKKLADKIDKKARNNYLKTDGSFSAEGTGKMLWNVGALVAGPLKIFASQVTAGLNIDKLAKSVQELTYAARGKDASGNDAVKTKAYDLNGSYEARSKKRKELEAEAVAKGYTVNSKDYKKFIKDGMREAFEGKTLAKDIAKEIGKVFSEYMPGANKASATVKATGDKLGQKQLETQEGTNKKLDTLIETMNSFIKKVGGGTP